MGKVILGRDVGFDCEGVIRADSAEDAIAQAVNHVRTVHGLTEMTEVADGIRAAMRDE